MKTIKSPLILILIVIIAVSCSKDKDLKLSSEILNGTWQEAEPKDLIQFAGSNHFIKFSNDSFFLKDRKWTDVINPEDTCPKTIYKKGKYSIESNKLILDGMYCDSSYVHFISDCKGRTDYKETYTYTLESNNELNLVDESFKSDKINLIKK